MKDVFAVQDDITRAIVGALQVRLASDAAPQATTSHGTTNLEAYDLYLRGLQLYRRRGAGLRQADTLLTKAIDLDPNFARAHAALASVLMVEPYYFNDVTIASVLPRSRAAAERAVAIDDGLAEAHQALGHVHTEAFEWAKAESELRRAVALNPSRAEAQFRLGFMLQYSGRTHEATTAFERAKSIDPFYPVSSAYLALSLALEEGSRRRSLKRIVPLTLIPPASPSAACTRMRSNWRTTAMRQSRSHNERTD